MNTEFQFNLTEFINNAVNERFNELVIKEQLIKPAKKNEQTEKFLSIKDASVFLNLAVATIYSKVSKRELPFIKRGKLLYFSSIELTDYIKSGRKKSDAELIAEADAFLFSNKKGLKS